MAFYGAIPLRKLCHYTHAVSLHDIALIRGQLGGEGHRTKALTWSLASDLALALQQRFFLKEKLEGIMHMGG